MPQPRPSGVTFVGVTDPPKLRSFPKGVLKSRASDGATPAGSSSPSSDNFIAQLFDGACNLDAAAAPTALDAIMARIGGGEFGGPHPSCLQVYTALLAVLRQPAAEKLLAGGKANWLLNHAKRDFSAFRKDNNPLSLRVVVQIFRLLDQLLLLPAVAKQIEPSTVSWYFGEAVSVLQDANCSKALTGVSIRIFHGGHPAEAISEDLARALLRGMGARPAFASAALYADYLVTYRMLLRQYRPLMLANAHLWVPMTVRCFFDTNAFLRQQALVTFTAVMQAHSCNVDVAKAVFDALAESYSQAQPEPLAIVGVHRLQAMLLSPGDAKSAMAVWSTVVLALTCWGPEPDNKLEFWPFLGKWLEICKAGFASPLASAKEATINAWKLTEYFFVFNGRSQRSQRNLQAIMHPFRLLKDLAPPLVKRFCAIYNAALYIALCCVPQSDEHYDIVWTSLVRPMLEHLVAGADTAPLSTTYFCHLVRQPPFNGQLRSRARVLQVDTELSDLPGLPRKWVHSRMDTLAACVAALQKQPQAIEMIRALAAACVNALDDDRCMIALVSGLAGASVSHEKKVELMAVVVTEIGPTELGTSLNIILDAVLSERVSLASATPALSRLLEAAGSRRRALTILQNAAERQHAWPMVASETSTLLRNAEGEVNEKDCDLALEVFCQAPTTDTSASRRAWRELLSTLVENPCRQLDKALSNAPAYTMSDLLDLRTSSPSLFKRFDTAIIGALVAHKYDNSLPDGLEIDFRVQLVRQMLQDVATTGGIRRALERASNWLQPSELAANADAFILAIRQAPENEHIALSEFWRNTFCPKTACNAFPDTVAYLVRNFTFEQNLPLPAGLSKRTVPFPSSSPPSTPSKRARCDSPQTGLQALELMQRVYASDDIEELAELKHETQKLRRPAFVPLLSEDAEICSSPPPMAEDDRDDPLRALKRVLITTDITAALKGATLKECQFVESLFMDQMVKLKLHMGNLEPSAR